MEENRPNSEALQYIADQAPGVIFLTSELMEQFQMTQDAALQCMVLGWKTGVLEPRFRLFDMPSSEWTPNLETLPKIVDTPHGVKTITPKDILMAFCRTTLN